MSDCSIDLLNREALKFSGHLTPRSVIFVGFGDFKSFNHLQNIDTDTVDQHRDCS